MPPTNRPPHDPFTTTTTTHHTLRTQPSQSSLRSTASAASTNTTTRTRQTRDTLFAPALSRRPTSRTRAMDDEVLADSSSEQERRRRVGGVRGRGRGSPAAGRHKKQHTEDLEIVKRDSQGNYLLGGSELMGNAKALVQVQDLVDEEEKALEEVDAYYEALAKRYFSSGAEVTTRRVEEDYERDRPDLMYHLKEQVIRKLESESWLYEPVDRLQPGIP